MQIKHKHILVPGQKYHDSRHLLQNSKVPKNVMGFNSHAQRSTPPYYLDVDNHLENLYVFSHHSIVVIFVGQLEIYSPDGHITVK